MKKQEKINLLKKGIEEVEICRCYYKFNVQYFYCYPNAVNDKFFMGQFEDDFQLNGYFVRKIANLEKVQIRNDKCNEINKLFGITTQIQMPKVDIVDWKSVFTSLISCDGFIIIEDEKNEQFVIGKIEKILSKKLYFKRFDAQGDWDDDIIEIPYSSITSVEWGDRYCKGWERYMELQEKKE